MELLDKRDGLALGICNGFQALIKLGLVPYGKITSQKEDSPTLTMNSIGRHQSKMVYTKVVTNKSPWLQKAVLGGVYTVPVSHGEGRFVAGKEWIDKLFALRIFIKYQRDITLVSCLVDNQAGYQAHYWKYSTPDYNGGDGLAAARILLEMGYLVDIYYVGGFAKVSEQFQVFL